MSLINKVNQISFGNFTDWGATDRKALLRVIALWAMPMDSNTSWDSFLFFTGWQVLRKAFLSVLGHLELGTSSTIHWIALGEFALSLLTAPHNSWTAVSCTTCKILHYLQFLEPSSRVAPYSVHCNSPTKSMDS